MEIADKDKSAAGANSLLSCLDMRRVGGDFGAEGVGDDTRFENELKE